MTAAAPRKRVFLVDDHPVVLAGVKVLVEGEADLEVVGVAGNAEAATAAIAAASPDIAIVDVSLPDFNGILLVASLRQAFPGLATVALTLHEEAAYVQQALNAGARGFILKRSAAEVLIHAIRAVLAGGTYVDPAVAAKVLRAPKSSATSTETLSDREIAVVKLVAKGFSNKEVSAQLEISVKTVETYRARATEKLGLRTRAALVRYATLEGWMME